MEKKKNNYFITTILFLFIIYICFYIASLSGYYDNVEYKKSTLTKEAMERFENDLKENKDISITDYIDNPYKSYSNKITTAGQKAGNVTSKIVKKGLKTTFKLLNKLFVE